MVVLKNILEDADFTYFQGTQDTWIVITEENISLREFADRYRKGKDSLMEYYRLASRSAERIAVAGIALFMRIEELELPLTNEIKLNTSPRGNPYLAIPW